MNFHALSLFVQSSYKQRIGTGILGSKNARGVRTKVLKGGGAKWGVQD